MTHLAINNMLAVVYANANLVGNNSNVVDYCIAKKFMSTHMMISRVRVAIGYVHKIIAYHEKH